MLSNTTVTILSGGTPARGPVYRTGVASADVLGMMECVAYSMYANDLFTCLPVEWMGSL